ncbi:MAG: CpaF family protein [Planctomycetes bacterium]|nr:CpaF family protein [Planctomycetota bacterium]
MHSTKGTGELAAPVAASQFVDLKAELHARVIADLQEEGLLGGEPEALEAAVQDWVANVLATEDLPLNEAERSRLGLELAEEATGLGPLGPLLADPAITDILVNGHDQVYVERFGRLERVDIRFADDRHLRRLIERLAMNVGRRIDQASPMVDLRLPDGSRVNATLPPVSIDGPTLSIRRFGRNRLRSVDVLRLNMLDSAMWHVLSAAVRGKRNILLSGGTGAGKSTLLGILAEAIPEDERIVTIEDTAELILDQEHVVRLETRPANAEGQGHVSARDLMINSLRMRPSRIIVGEVRAGEALDMLQAMNTGHEGGLCTVHANSTRDALARLETMVLMAGADLPSQAIREQITSALDLVVHVRRYEDGIRRIAAVSEVTGLESGTPLLQDIFVFRTTSTSRHRIEGRFEPTGIVPRFVQDERSMGVDLPLELFRMPEQS